MENVLLDRSSGSFELPKTSAGATGRCRRATTTPRGAYAHHHRSLPTTYQQPVPYHHPQRKGGAWSSAPPALPSSYAARPPPMFVYSSTPSLPLLLPSNQPPLLPLPPAATKYATFPCQLLPAPPRAVMAGAGAVTTTTVPAVAAAAPAAPRSQRDRRRRPARPPPTSTETPKAAQRRKPLERATPLPPAPAVNEALDDLEQEVARNFVQDLLHALAPPPSSLPLPTFALVAKASPARTAAPSCNVEAATADGIRGILRL